MNQVPDQDHLEELLRPVLANRGVDLEDIHVSPVGRRSLLRVVVDKDGGVTLDDLADLTHDVSSTLDHDDAMEDLTYTLEVTSPGIDRPLTLPRHWRRNTGRLVEVRAADDTTVTGRITEANETSAVLTVGGEQRPIRYADVRRALVQVEFSKPGRDTTDAEGGSRGH